MLRLVVSPFYATCNAKRLILFQHKIRVKAFESEVASYDYVQVSDWARSLLEISLGLVPVRLLSGLRARVLRLPMRRIDS